VEVFAKSCCLHWQKTKIGNKIAQFESCTFTPRTGKTSAEVVEIVPCASNKWGNWWDFWFYVAPADVEGLSSLPPAILCSHLSAFRPGGSLDRRVNCCCVSQPRWVGARWDTKGENSKGKPRPSCCPAPRADGCACSRGLQAFVLERERARALCVSPFSRAANLLVREPWTFLL
jgi:hypothetical protein